MNDKEDVVHKYSTVLTQPLKKNQIMPSAVMWMDLEMTMLNTK